MSIQNIISLCQDWLILFHICGLISLQNCHSFVSFQNSFCVEFKTSSCCGFCYSPQCSTIHVIYPTVQHKILVKRLIIHEPANKVGCVFQVVIWSAIRVGQYRDEDYLEDASHFIRQPLFESKSSFVLKFWDRFVEHTIEISDQFFIGSLSGSKTALECQMVP